MTVSVEENYWQRRRRYTRRGFIRGMGLAAGVVTLAPVVAACGGGSNKNTSSAGNVSSNASPAGTAASHAGAATGTAAAASNAKPVKGGTLTLAVARDITTFDPVKSQDVYSDYAITNMTNALVHFNEKLQPVPSLVKSWDISSDGTTYTFHLQTGVKFHDGTDFNADAVKFNLNRHIQDPKSVRHSDVADVKDITVIDPMTVKLTLGHPFAPFLSKLTGGAGYMLSPTAVQKLGDKINTDFTGAGTGPYKFSEWLKDDHFTAVRNENYWEKDSSGTQLPYTDKLIFKPIPDENVRLQNLKSSAVDVLPAYGGPPNKDIASLKTDSSLVYQQAPGLGFSFIMLEVEKPPFDKKEVRQALAYSIDRAQIAKTVYFDTVVPNDTVIPGTVPGGDPNFHPYLKQDVNKAKQLLQQAGQSKVSFAMQISSSSPAIQQLAELMKDQISGAGFDMQIQPIEFATLVANGNKGDYQAGALGWSGSVDPDGDTYPLFYTKAGFNLAHYSNPSLDQLLDKGRQTVDAQARIGIYQQIDKLLADDLPFVILNNPVVNYAALKKVQNFPINLATVPVQGFSQVWKTG